MKARALHPHYLRILAAQIFLLFLTAVMRDHILIIILFILGLFGVLGSVVGAIWDRAHPRAAALAFGLIALAGLAPAVFPGTSWQIERELLVVSCASYSIFFIVAILAIGKSVFVTDRVTANLIAGSIVLYLLIGMLFAFTYAGFDLMLPGSIHIPSHGGPMLGRLTDFLYFSFSTLTTTGYGDAVPVHPVAKMLASLEGIGGSIYLAIMVARLVGMHVMQHSEK